MLLLRLQRISERLRKRTSFVYPELTKKKKSADEVYCVCRRKYKKSECMWCCDSCTEWFHPKCIGRDDEEEPPRNETSFLCKPCLTEQLKEWSVDGIESLLGSTVDEEDLDEEDFLIKMEEVQKHMREAYARCWYLVRLEGNRSYMPWMKRHIMFTKQRGLPHSQGFGEALFSPQAICMIKVNLRKRFQKLKDSSSIYSVHYVIPSVANEDLKSFFEEETGQSENYIYKVMVKEAMITIMQEAIGDEYENVDVELRKTEGKTTNKSNSLLLNYIMNDREKYIQLHKRN
ncbi:uncharacterized protein LOC123557253 [Mercenaria mercenaria]|uniref:uncharacterized protein LOC123557253 n=1 Tax=Mercenaria mercenaria TaxID=6596 RepID=UPI001E1D68D5|nr:uncharacterized protein LOC123557253 [Mercenaria mercenaria]